MFTEDTLDIFKRITGYDVTTLLYEFTDFMDNDYSNIEGFYAGTVKTPNGQSFKNLDYLLQEYAIVINLTNIGKNSFKTVECWELMGTLEDVYVKLLTTSNISKFLRSSIAKGTYNLGVSNDYGLKYKETLEKASDNLNSLDSQNDWTNLAINNDLEEEDYTPDGGVLLKVVFAKNPELSMMTSVVDNIVGEKMYGLDINKKLTFVSDDLDVLSYKDTIRQAIDILANLRQGDVPEFPNDGLQEQFAVGTNIGSIQFPALFRQQTNLFAKDDSITGFALKSLKREQDAIFLEYEVNTRLNEILTQKIKI